MTSATPIRERRRRLDTPPPPSPMAPPDPDWVGGVDLDVGDHRISVVADAHSVLDVIRDVFGRWIVGDSETSGGLRRQRRAPRRCRSSAHPAAAPWAQQRAPIALVAAVAAPTGHRPRRRRRSASGAVRAHGGVRARRAGRARFPRAVAERSTAVERALVGAGATIAEQAAIRIDLATREIVVTPGLTHPQRVPQLMDDLATAPGRYAVRGHLLVRGPARRTRTGGDRRRSLGRADRPRLRRRPPTGTRADPRLPRSNRTIADLPLDVGHVDRAARPCTRRHEA